MRSNPQLLSTARRTACAAAIAWMSVSANPAGAQDALCFNSATTAPTIDGVVINDNGWMRANQYVFNNGSPSPHAVVQMARAGSNVYLSFEVSNDPTFDDLDVISLVFDPDGNPATNAANDRRIHIFPVATNAGNATSTPGGPPREVKYWTGSGDWNSTGNEALPAWLQNASGNIRVTSSNPLSPGLRSYVLEMRIPVAASAASGIDLGTSFGLYYNIVRVDSTGGGLSALGELHWPTGSALDVGGDLPAAIAIETNTPAPGSWGDGQMTGTCPGVKVTNVFTNHPTDSNGIDPNSTNNRFNVTLTNTGSAPASGITATIKSTRFGVGSAGAYGPIGPKLNPLPALGPSGSIAAGGGTVTLQSQPWDVLSDPDRATYLTWSNVCSIVELNSTVGGTLIANRYHYWNLHFATASRFQHRAVINARGLRAPAGSTRQRLELQVDVRDEQLTREDHANAKLPVRISADTPMVFGGTATALSPAMQKLGYLQVLARYFPKYAEGLRANKVVSVSRHIVHGYFETGRFIEIEGVRHRLKEPINSYAYVLFHDGQVAQWTNVLAGPGIERAGTNRYLVQVPLNGETTATTTAEAREGRLQGLCASLNLTSLGTAGVGLAIIGFGVYWPRRREKRKGRSSDA